METLNRAHVQTKAFMKCVKLIQMFVEGVRDVWYDIEPTKEIFQKLINTSAIRHNWAPSKNLDWSRQVKKSRFLS